MAEDFGLYAKPVSHLFKQPESRDEWESYMLTADQIRHFKEYGYITGIKILNDGQIEALLSELEKVIHPDNPGNEYFYEYNSNESANPDTVLFHALGAWRVTPGFHDILWAPGFRMPAYQLLGKGYRFFHDQLFCKPAKHGSVVSWHQDFSYWTWTAPMAHLTCWIALDDATIENGCMYYIPKSHTWGLLPKTGLAGDMDAVRKVLNPEQVKWFDKRVPVAVKKGEASFHHPLLMHGSHENRSASPRRATLINVFSDGVISNRDWENEENQPGTENYPKIPKGQKMGGTYYPLLFDTDKELSGFTSIHTIDSV